MGDLLFQSLKLEAGARVLDAGCGVRHVASHMASKGLQVLGIDVVERHAQEAMRNVQAAGYEKTVSVRLMDYHHLDPLDDNPFDGVYTMETLVHATDPESVLAEFFRVLKPGGSPALHEYDHLPWSEFPKDVPDGLIKSAEQVNEGGALTANQVFDRGVLEAMLERQGFEKVELQDLTENVKLMMMLFFIFA